MGDFLNYTLHLGEHTHVSVKQLLIIVFLTLIIHIALRLFKRTVSKRMPEEDVSKFETIFSYISVLIYTILLLIIFNFVGFEIKGILTASAALLVGVGLALQTLFQDIISGIFILIDKTLHVGDVIEIEGKIAKVTSVKLRTTRARTIDNKVIIIPNHKYLVSILYNWTENSKDTRESVAISVAYGSDLDLVKKILIDIAIAHPAVYNTPTPQVLFLDFGANSLDLKLIFSVRGDLNVVHTQSDLRFEIDKKFREHQITIPFPQRELYIHNKK